MAKNKGGRGAVEETEDAASGTGANGALLFEDMGAGFVIPSKLGHSQWDDMVRRILETEKGPNGFPVKVLYKDVTDNVQKVYTRAKQLKNAATRLEADITVAVRRLPGNGTDPVIHALLAQRNK